METKITSRTDTTAEFTITMQEAELREVKAHVFDDLRKQVKAAGFRPGKAPDMIVERELGAGVVQSEFIEHAVQHSYPEAIKKEGLQTVASPQVSLLKFVPYTELEYKVVVELLPKVKLADYKKIRVKKPQIKIEKKEVDQAIEDLRRRLATRIDREHDARKGDEVNFDFEGTKDGEPVSGASAKNQTLQLGSGQFIPGFEDQLVGLKKGEEKTFEIRFPKEYQEKSLANELVKFHVKLNSVTELVLPETNQEFVEQVSPFKSLADLRSDIETRIKDDKEQSAQQSYESQVLDKLLEESEYKTPESLTKQQIDRMRAELEQNLAASGLNVEKYLELAGKSAEEMEGEMRPEAERRVGLALVLTEVAAQENLSVPAAELDAEIDRMKAEYPDPATQAELSNPRTREEVYNHLMASKVIARLLEYAEK
jgi:trigger factor